MKEKSFSLTFLYQRLKTSILDNTTICCFTSIIQKETPEELYFFSFSCNQCPLLFSSHRNICFYNDPISKKPNGFFSYSIRGDKEKFLKQLVKDFPSLLLDEKEIS